MRGTAVRLALLVVVATGLAVGSSGFGAVEADRSVSVNVVGADEAYVGADACTNGNGNGNVVHLRVTNRFADSFEVESVTSADAGLWKNREPEPKGHTDLSPGSEVELTQKFDGPVGTVEIAVTGASFDATITVEVKQSRGSNCPGSNGSPESNSTTTTPR